MIESPVFNEKSIVRVLTDWARNISREHNNLASGFVSATRYYTAAPTTSRWNRGDFVRNSTPSEVGTVIPKYSIIGWLCVAEGEPGTWVEVRGKTGAGTDFTKILTGSADIDFASIAAGAVATADIAITGAAAADFVTLSAPAALEAGLTFCGIANTDKVTIRLHNTTGAAIDPAAATWKATVTLYA